MPRHLIVGDSVTDLVAAGSSGEVQWNSGGSIAGASGLITNGTKLGVGISPTAMLHLKAGTASANTAPLKFTAGTNLGTPETGALEFNGANLFITDNVLSGIRRTLLYADLSNLTGTVSIARGGTATTSQTTNGLCYYNGSIITSGSNVTYDGTTFQVNGKYFATTFNTASTPTTSDGLAIAWNKSGGSAEVNFYNRFNNGGGSQGGFDYWQGTASNTYTRLAFLDANSYLYLYRSSSGVQLGGDWSLSRDGSASATVSGRLYVNAGTWTSTSTNRSAIQSGVTLNPSGASSARVWGLFFGANGAGNQNITDGWALNGMEGNAGYSGSATCAGANGVLAYCYNNGTGTLTDARGLHLIGMPDNAASGGHMTNIYWLEVNPYAPAFSANNQKRIGIQIDAMPSVGLWTGCTSAAIAITGTSGNTRDGIQFGGDSFLYRPSSGVIGTDVDFAVMTAGKGLRVKEGSNAKMGTSTLVGGTVTVSTTAVTANSRIFLTGQNSSGTHGELTVSARVAGTSFTITSSSGTDTRSVAWLLMEPA